LVFEDALFHIVDYLIKLTGSDRLVLTGGTALNAIGNMRLLEHFDEAFFQHHLGRHTRLHVWVPPTLPIRRCVWCRLSILPNCGRRHRSPD